MFESSVIVSREHKSNPKRLVILPVSVALHVAAIAAGILASTWTVELPTGSPDQFLTFFVEPMIPAPQAPVGPGTPEAPEPEPATTDVDVDVRETAPIEVPEQIPEVSGPGEPVLSEGSAGRGDPRGEPGGDPNGSPDGIDGGVSLGGPPPPERFEPVYAIGDVAKPVVIYRVEPEYPELLRRIGVQGPVIVQCIIDRRGMLRDVTVLRSPHPMLSESVTTAIRQWRFEPGTLDGRPLDVIFNLTVNFSLAR